VLAPKIAEETAQANREEVGCVQERKHAAPRDWLPFKLARILSSDLELFEVPLRPFTCKAMHGPLLLHMLCPFHKGPMLSLRKEVPK